MNLRRMIMDNSKNEFVPHDKGLYAKVYLYVHSGKEFIAKLELSSMTLKTSHSIYGRDLIEVGTRIWWQDIQETVLAEYTYTFRHFDVRKNETVISDAILTAVGALPDEDQHYDVTFYANKMEYFGKDLTYVKF